MKTCRCISAMDDPCIKRTQQSNSGRKRKINEEKDLLNVDPEHDQHHDDLNPNPKVDSDWPDDVSDDDDDVDDTTGEGFKDEGIHPRDLTEEQLLLFVDPPDRPLLKEVIEDARQYLIDLEESKGFEITAYPGSFYGLTTIMPFGSILESPETNPRLYGEIISGAEIAVAHYNKHNPHTEFVLLKVENVNVWFSLDSDFYITFSAIDIKYGGDNKSAAEEKFQALVTQYTIEKTLEVSFCRIKPKA